MRRHPRKAALYIVSAKQDTLPALETLFELAEFSPNENQDRAIKHTDGPLFLVAGAGSGKTRVLLWRTVNLIVFHGIKPEEIFLSTFTEKAAKQLNDGLLGLLGMVSNMTGETYDISKMYISHKKAEPFIGTGSAPEGTST